MNNDDLGVKATGNNVAQPDPIKANIDEEAKAEEAFVNDEEDAVFNPFVEDENAVEEEEILTDADMEIPGAVGSGNLETVMPNDPINNEEAFHDDVKMQDLQSDIDTGAAIDDEALPSAEETVKVNVGESMQPEEKPEVGNSEVASQMDDLLNDANVVENTTPGTEVAAEAAAPAIDTPAESTSSNPVAEAVAANPVVETAPAATESPVAATVQAAEPARKKGGAGKIIAIIVILLLLIGGGVGAILFMNWHESKDKVASDAMSKLFNIKLVDDKITSAGNGIGATKLSGSITTTGKDVEDYKDGDRYAEIKSVTGEFNAELDDLNAKLSGSLSVKLNNGDSSKAGVEAAYLAGGKVYFKLGKIADYEELFDSLSGYKYVDDDDDYSYAEEESKAVKEFKEKQQEILTSRIEEKWIGISNDTFKYLVGDGYGDQYSCIINSVEKVAKENKDKLLDAYKSNSFFEFGDVAENVNGAKDGLTYYVINIDDDKLKSFGKEVEKIDSSVEITKCFESMTEEYIEDAGKISQTAAEKEDEIDAKIYFGIKSWSHEVMNIIVEDEDKASKTVLNVDLGYDPVKVSEPADAKQLEKVAEEAYDAYIKLIDDNWDTYIESVCGEEDDYFYSSCKENQRDSFDQVKDLSFSEFLKLSTQSAFSTLGGEHYSCDDDLECIEDEDWDWEDEDWDF